MRVTGLSQGAAMRTDLALAGGRLSAIQRQLASGRRLERVSDGPAAGLEAMRYRRSLRGHAQYARNTGDAKSWLRTADSTLNDVDDRLTRARELTIQSINGSLGAEARSAIAEELRGIADELVGLANADHLGRPIFSGTAATDVAYQIDGTYVGDLSAVNRRISPNATVQVNVAGPGVFGVQDLADPANGNIFQVIRSIADDVESGTQTAAGLDAIDLTRDRVASTEAALGTRLASIERIENRSKDTEINTRASLTSVEDVDLTDAILSLRSSEASYTAALNVAARVLDNSLLDFLR